MANKSVERDFGLAAPVRSAANPKRLTLDVGRTKGCAWLKGSEHCGPSLRDWPETYSRRETPRSVYLRCCGVPGRRSASVGAFCIWCLRFEICDLRCVRAMGTVFSPPGREHGLASPDVHRDATRQTGWDRALGRRGPFRRGFCVDLVLSYISPELHRASELDVREFARIGRRYCYREVNGTRDVLVGDGW